MIDAGVLGPEDHVELIEGEILQMSPEKTAHAVAIDLAAEALRRAYRSGSHVRVQHPLAIGDDSEPEPDLAVVAGTPRDYVRSHPTRALLVVEVAESSLAYDRTTKVALYARAGIPEYWIVDLAGQALEVHRQPGRQGYESVERLGRGAAVSPETAGGASVAIADLLP